MDGACLNCGDPVPKRFCSNCGQDNLVRRLSVKRLMRNLLDDLFRLESPLLRTLTELSYRPGDVALRYVQGHRRSYTNPLKYCLLAAALSVLAYHLLGPSPPEPDWSAIDHEAPDFWSMWYELDWEIENELFENLAAVIERHYSLTNLLFIPFLALWTRLLFYRVGMNFAEHSVLALYVMAHSTLLTIPVEPWVQSEADWALGLIMIVWLLLWVVACHQFFPGGTLSKLVRSVLSLTFFLVMIFVVLIGAHFALLWVAWAFPGLIVG